MGALTGGGKLGLPASQAAGPISSSHFGLERGQSCLPGTQFAPAGGQGLSALQAKMKIAASARRFGLRASDLFQLKSHKLRHSG